MAELAAAWSRLDAAARETEAIRIQDCFAAEPDRLARMTLDAAGLFLVTANLGLVGWGITTVVRWLA